MHLMLIETLEPRKLFSTIVVNSIVDAYIPGSVTLPSAINAADRSSDPTTITFDPSLDGQTILMLGNGGFLMGYGATQPITIIGPASGITLEGNSTTTAICFIYNNVSISNVNMTNSVSRLIYNTTGSTLTLNNVNLTNTNGLIQNYGTIYSDMPLSTVQFDLANSLIGHSNEANGYLDLGNSVEIKYTLFGDTNLDGTVDFTDFMHMSQHFTQTGVGWAQGDFNYDGVVNADDFNLLKPNYGKTIPPPQVAFAANSQPDIITTRKTKRTRIVDEVKTSPVIIRT